MRVHVWEGVCACAEMCTHITLASVRWPLRYTMGHLHWPSAPTKLPLGVGVLTMFWTISSNKSQPKLLVSVSVAKWQTVHPPKSSLLPKLAEIEINKTKDFLEVGDVLKRLAWITLRWHLVLWAHKIATYTHFHIYKCCFSPLLVV